jgi:hypothetical protein
LIEHFAALFIKLGAPSIIWSGTMAIDEKLSNVRRRSGKDRRSGVDTRGEEEKKLVGERRSTTDRRSGHDRRSVDPLSIRDAFGGTFSLELTRPTFIAFKVYSCRQFNQPEIRT